MALRQLPQATAVSVHSPNIAVFEKSQRFAVWAETEVSATRIHESLVSRLPEFCKLAQALAIDPNYAQVTLRIGESVRSPHIPADKCNLLSIGAKAGMKSTDIHVTCRRQAGK